MADDISATVLAAKRALDDMYEGVLRRDIAAIVECAIALGRHAEQAELWAYREGRK